MKISVERIYYPVTVLGPGKRVGIWLRGCDRNCEGCISPELKTYDVRKEFETDDIVQMLRSIPNQIDGITISGGEPFYKPEALCELIEKVSTITDDILIFTGYTFAELTAMQDEAVNRTLQLCAALVDGPYVKEFHTKAGLRGSSNQNCIVFKYKEKYANIELDERQLQIVVSNQKMITIGIP